MQMPKVDGWEHYAREKVSLAYEKLIKRPEIFSHLDLLEAAKSDLSAVFDADVPEHVRPELHLAKDQGANEAVTSYALRRLYAALPKTDRG
jgi:hypothetical protein